MGLEDMKMFHLTSRNKLKELTEKEYLRFLERKGYLVGWVDGQDILFHKKDNSGSIWLSRSQVMRIFNLWDNQKEAVEK